MAGKTAKNAHLWERHPDDWYVEEVAPTTELLKVEAFLGAIWDPCCGRAHVLAAAQAAGYEVFGSDIKDRARVVDVPFIVAPFAMFPCALAPNVIMNPPYLDGGGIEQFVRQAMSYREVRKIAVFAPSKFLWGQNRALYFYRKCEPARVYMITPRPSAPPGPVWEQAPEEVGGGSEDFCWLIWERDEASGSWMGAEATQLYWIVGEGKRKRKAA